MSKGIFVSYRRDDTRHVAGRLAGELAQRFGAEGIFRDVESIDGGQEFPVQLEKALGQCAVMLVLIGPGWLGAADKQGRRRLDDPEDWVRQEIAGALRRGISVVPVLVEGTPLPSAEQLPDDLKPLTKRQYRQLADERWRGDLVMLSDLLVKQSGLVMRSSPDAAPAAAAPAPAPKRTGLIVAGVLGAIVVGIVAWPKGGDAAATLPDLSGSWRTDDNYHYTFVQDGPEVKIGVKLDDKEHGSGSGRFDDGVLKLSFTAPESESSAKDNCELTAAADYKSFEGQCKRVGQDEQGKDFAPYAYKIFR